jgi:enoyl-CoA hydratase/carnithine racemase
MLNVNGDICSRLDDRGVLTITLNRPDRLNALTRPMLATLGDLFDEAGRDNAVLVILLTGEGRGFCSGADAGSLLESARQSAEERMSVRPRFTPRQCGIYKPSICAVNGVCAGAGLHFVSDMDIVIAGRSASFTDTHVNVGQVTAQEPIGLARRLPLGAVLRLVMLGRYERLSAERALELQLVSEVLPDEALRDRAYELALVVAAVSPVAVQTSLKALWESFEPRMSEVHAAAYETVMRHRDHPDASEGPRAFIAKRPPKWTV